MLLSALASGLFLWPIASATPALLRRADPTVSSRNIPHKFRRLVSIGDSYSAGPGNTGETVTSGPNYGKECYRHEQAWPYVLAQALGLQNAFTFSACSGYNTTQIQNIEVTSPSSSFGNPDLVTITSGGNDGNSFTSVVTACGFNLGDCDEALQNANATLSDPGFDRRLDSLLGAAGTHNNKGTSSSARTVLFMGYPVFFNDMTRRLASGSLDCDSAMATRHSIDLLGTALDSKQRAAVDRANAKPDRVFRAIFKDPNTYFDGHRFCEPPGGTGAYFQGGLNLNIQDGLPALLNGIFHPNRNGHVLLANAAIDALAMVPA